MINTPTSGTNTGEGHSVTKNPSLLHVKSSSPYGEYIEDSESVMKELKDSWRVDVNDFNTMEMDAPLSRCKLNNVPDAILLSESWNKILAFRSMFSEALIGRWRVLVAADEIQREEERKFRSRFWVKNVLSSTSLKPAVDDVENKILRMLESNSDPIAKQFGMRTSDLEIITISALDAAFRELCPHTQVVQRESYRPLMGSADPDHSISRIFYHENECTTFKDYCDQLGRYGVLPRHFLAFGRAFLWAMKEHNPYSLEDEVDDLDLPTTEGVHARFIAGMFVLPIIEVSLRNESHVRKKVFQDLRHHVINLENMETQFEKAAACLVDKFLGDFPDLLNHFSLTDTEELKFRLFELMLVMVRDAENMTAANSYARVVFQNFGDKWSDLGLSVESFLLLGKEIMAGFVNLIDVPKETRESLSEALFFLQKRATAFVLQPVLMNQNLKTEASRFYDNVAIELNWSPHFKEKRLFEVHTEISATGTYTHTKEELEIGARLSWRNSAKCIGRIAWNTLVVRDCRSCKYPKDIFNEVVEHLKLATGGTNIQSVMTIFRPQRRDEIWGMRFWSSQFVRYAGYVDGDDGNVLGDPANIECTNFLVERNLWVPPSPRTAFDVLPLVLKVPNNEVLFVHELPKEVIHEVNLEHPDYPELEDLGYKWAAVPAISNFTMNLGGIKYPCAPFNGWFLSTEIVRNLLERYNTVEPLAETFGINLRDKLLHQKVSVELETAVLHSFEKNDFTMVDPMTVGKSFLTHCKRERKLGRECPGQWSWIGGLVGPTNPTWHLEMRDFKVAPQYDYCCDPWKVLSIGEIGIQSRDSNQETTNDNTEEHSIPKLLIAYGSETGTAEAAAASLAKRFKACKPFLCTLNEVTTKIETLKTFDHILIICSTFGKGNPPNNAVDFFKSDLTGKLNEHTWFAVLALGSSLYPDYCKAGEEVGEQMKEAGAQPIMEIRRVDTAHGNQAMILEWSNQAKKLILPDSILESIKASDANRGRQRIPPTYSVKWRVEEEFQGDVVDKSEGALRCSKNIELFDEVHAQISQRSTRHIEFELPEEMTYETADNLSVTPHNSIEMIARLVNCFAHELEKAAIKMGYFSMPHLDAEVKQLLILMGRKFNCTPHIAYVLQQPFYIECIEDGQINAHPDQNMTNKSLLHVFREVVDLSFNSAPYLVDFLSMLLSKLDSASLSSVEAKSFRDMATPLTQQDSCEDGDERIKDFSDRYPTAPDLLENFEDLFCKPFGERKEGLMNLADILVLMPKLKPRLYSISSSDLVTPRNISITAGLVNFTTTAMVTVKGVCSHHLARLNPGDQLNAKIIKSSFRLPLSNTSPIIMIGAGTGLAPYMGFLREREEYMSQSGLHFGKCHLFFGCRSDDEYLYMDQLQQWQNEEIMELHIAQTREAEKPRKQVQHSLADHGAELVELLMSEEKTHVYICGNAIMADSCREAFIELLKTHGNMSKILATQMLASMHIDNRWHLDVWGSTKEIDIGIDISSHPPRRDLGKSQFSFIRRFVHKNSMVESRDIYPLVE